MGGVVMDRTSGEEARCEPGVEGDQDVGGVLELGVSGQALRSKERVPPADPSTQHTDRAITG
jgi:hypothetical protein